MFGEFSRMVLTTLHNITLQHITLQLQTQTIPNFVMQMQMLWMRLETRLYLLVAMMVMCSLR
jgi:hypothetical protein